MLKSNAPAKFTVPFATSGAKNSIPITPPVTPGLASYQQGFPPTTMEPIASGGIPPYGQDFNGILNAVNVANLWQQSGFVFSYDAVFATDSNIGGYPAQALLCRTDGLGFWLNTTDNNTSSPDTTGSSGWLSVRANAGAQNIAVSVGTNTPDPSLLGLRLLVITGSIASPATLVLPLTRGASWLIQNSTTGAGSLGVQGSTGSGVTVPQGTIAEVVTDGTNYYTSAFNGSGVYLPISGTAVAATKLATARTIAMTGDVAWTSPGFDGTTNVTAAGTIQSGAVTLAKMAAFQANSLMGNPTGSTVTPQAITLSNGIQFSGTSLSLGNITPASAAVTGALSAGGVTTLAKTIVQTGSLGVGTDPTSVPGIGNPAFGSNNIIVYNPGDTFLGLLTDATSGRTSRIGFGFAGTATFDAGMEFLNASRSLRFYSGNVVHMSLDVSGNLAVTGTGNFQTSDARVKSNFVSREPIPSHNAWWGDYDRIDVKGHGVGHRAQDIQKTHPHRVHFVDGMNVPGTDEPMMFLDRIGLSEEQGIWNGRQIDLLLERMDAVEKQLGVVK